MGGACTCCDLQCLGAGQLQVLSQAFTLTFLAEWGDRSNALLLLLYGCAVLLLLLYGCIAVVVVVWLRCTVVVVVWLYRCCMATLYCCSCCCMAALYCCCMTEYGGRSQIATVALAADKNPFGIVYSMTLSCCLPHTLACCRSNPWRDSRTFLLHRPRSRHRQAPSRTRF